MQSPGGWLQLGFILNWKCLVPGVKAKPCIGHWDSCAQEETRVSWWGIWTCSPGEQGTAGSQDALSLGWPGARGRNRQCSASHCKPTSKLRILNSFTEAIKKHPFCPFFSESFPAFFPCPSLLCSSICSLESWCLWDRNTNVRKSMNIRIMWGHHLRVGRAGS